MYFLINFPFMDLVMYYRGFSLYIVVGAFLNALETPVHNFPKISQKQCCSLTFHIHFLPIYHNAKNLPIYLIFVLQYLPVSHNSHCTKLVS